MKQILAELGHDLLDVAKNNTRAGLVLILAGVVLGAVLL